MRTDVSKQNEKVKWQDLTPGCRIAGVGTSVAFHTGEWRVNTPVIDMEKCTQCLMCAAVCPDSSIPVIDKKRGDFDYDHCKGCGICAKVCPFHAIEMKEGGK